jgi:hypothetical protein
MKKQRKQRTSSVRQTTSSIEAANSWLPSLLWCVISLLIGVIIGAFTLAFTLLLPRGDIIHFNVGGLFGYSYVNWRWYHILSGALISVAAVSIAWHRRSVAKLILFTLFSATGMTFVITTFEIDDQVFAMYLIVATIALILSVLVYYRSMIVEQCRDAWARSPLPNYSFNNAATEDVRKISGVDERDNTQG